MAASMSYATVNTASRRPSALLLRVGAAGLR